MTGHQRSRRRVSRHRRRSGQKGPKNWDDLCWRILRELATFVWLRTDQLERLLAPASTATVGRRLRLLFDAKLVERIQLPVNNQPIIHTLTAEGAKTLRKLGYEIPYWKPWHQTPGRFKGDPLGYFRLGHALLANEIAIRLIISATEQGFDYVYQDEADLKEKMKIICPDKHLLLIPNGNVTRASDLFIEADTGEMRREQIRNKLLRYHEYIFSAYPKDFLSKERPRGSPLILIVTQREKRQEQRPSRVVELCQWIHQTALELDKEDLVYLFRVTHLNLLEGSDLVREPFWNIPGVGKPQPLFW